jgi:hypothetical protein
MGVKLRVFAYCAKSFEQNVRRVAGVQPLTCPPVSLETFSSEVLEGHDLLYFKLHGLPGQSYWYGDNLITAISADQIRQADLGGAGVFVANCFTSRESPMFQALREAGARWIISGEGENYASSQTIAGVDLLGLYFRRLLGLGLGAARAFKWAKWRLRHKKLDKRTRDTLDFKMYVREDDRWAT